MAVAVESEGKVREREESENVADPKEQLQREQHCDRIGPSEGLGGDSSNGDGRKEKEKDMKELVELLSKLNPLAEEFVPHSLSRVFPVDNGKPAPTALPPAGAPTRNANYNNPNNRRRKNGYSQTRRRTSSRINREQREESVRRTVYVSDIDQMVTEEQLAALFINCGQVVDCRVCGDPNSVLRFAFVEFTDEESARAAMSLSGTVLGFYPVRVLPSKTAILPVNPTFLPSALCGEVSRLRLLGDYQHSTRIAFVEFVHAESAMAALNCSGAILGSLPIRVSPSKTPVRPRNPRP